MDEDVQQLIQDTVKENMEASRQTLLQEIGTMFEKISEQNNHSQLAKISNLVASEHPKFKRKSNEEQFKANSKVLLKLNEASGNLNQQNVQEAKSNIKEAVEMLSHRQKLIQMADSSELGWRVVHEYESNPLAEDSEDEKKMYKAEARANRKMKAERAKKTKLNKSWPYKRPMAGRIVSSTQTITAPVQKPGLCFQCGKAGHWRKECPGNTSNNKISICTDYILQESRSKDADNVVVNEFRNEFDNKGHIEGVSDSGSIQNNVHEYSILDDSATVRNREPLISPVGRLRSHASKWRSVSGDSYIVDVVENGYKLPFKAIPPSVNLRNNKSARDNPSFVTTEIESLIRKGVISVVEQVPLVVNPLTVAYNKSLKPRLVLDCRHINHFLHVFKLKFEDIRVAQSLFDTDFYAFTYDLKGAYLHIDIFKDHRTYLGFCWNYYGQKTYFVFNSLPFGIASAGHIFSKTVRVLVTYVRSLGHKVIMYLDDGIGGHIEYDKALQSSSFVRNTFCEFGFLIAEEKCHWLPAKTATWLGYVLDFYQNKLFITEDRIALVEKVIESLLYQIRCDKCSVIKVRVLASLVGRLISLQFVLGNIVRLRTREMYNCIISRASWEAPVLVTEAAMEEILFWKQNVRRLNNAGKNFRETQTCDVAVYCDASACGYGGYLELLNKDAQSYDKQSGFETADTLTLSPEAARKLSPEVDRPLKLKLSPEDDYVPPEAGVLSDNLVTHDRLPAEEGLCSELRFGIKPVLLPGADVTQSAQSTAHTGFHVCKQNAEKVTVNRYYGAEVTGSWLEEEQVKSSSWREAEAVNRVIRSQVNHLKNKTVKVFSDNKNVKSFLLNGSRKRDIQNIALNVDSFCGKNNIRLFPEWIPREMNQLSDYLSRCHDCDDWSISESWFSYLDSIWGRHTVDRFSTHYNNHCQRFNSRWWVPGTEGVNTFNHSWKSENNWLVPPPRLVVDCINKIESEQACCTLIVPRWKSAPFWPCLINADGNFKSYIRDVKLLPKERLIRMGKGVDLKPTIRSLMNNAGVDVQNHGTVIDHMAGYIIQSKADSTCQKYMNCFKHFDEYCQRNNFKSKPAASIVVAMYLTQLLDQGKTYSVISAAVYAIKWMHSIHDFGDPTCSSMVKHLVEAAKRLRSSPVQKKDIIDTDMLQKLCIIYTDTSDVVTLRDLSMILLGYAGFLRFNELSSLCCSDILFNADHLLIIIRKSKTDMYREGRQIPIAKGSSQACPYNMLEKYMRQAGLSVSSNDFLFRPCFRSQGVSSVVKTNKKLSYTRVRECILSKLKLVAPHLNLGTHSLRASGATAAANAEGVSDRCLKRHGRWKTDLAKDGYIVDSLDSRLLITKKLKL